MEVISMWCMESKDKGIICSFESDLGEQLLSRLFELGLRADEGIECLRKSPIKGPKMFQISDSVLSLEKSIAERIFVKKA